MTKTDSVFLNQKDWSIRTVVSATPRTGGKPLVASLASRSLTPRQKLDALTKSLQSHANKLAQDFCITLNDPMSGIARSFIIHAVRS